LVINPLSGDVRPGGSQGFPGYSQEINKSRNNFAAYVDTELDITKNWMVSVAGRFENYNDFGSTLNGKLATRYKITPQFAFRGSFSTGFRAPSLAQKYYSLQFTNFQGGSLVTIQLASNDSNLAKAVGIPQLKQETSVNGSAGFTFNTGKFTATVDGYYIKVKDRIVLTGNFSQDDDAIGNILIENRIDQAQFFTNAIDTRTKGVDVILSFNENIGKGKLTATLAGNYNEMEITKVNTSDRLKGKEDIYLSPRERAFILASAPKTKINLNLNYKISKFNANLQLVRFDKVTLVGYNGPDDYKYTIRK
jgi:iron complex outermembrane receptor protein